MRVRTSIELVGRVVPAFERLLLEQQTSTCLAYRRSLLVISFFFFKQKTAYEMPK